MSDWNPQLYLKYKNERTRPVRDLIARIDLDAPRRILDIGCGPGNSTAELVRRFPRAQIIGIDFSEAMVERAKKECAGAQFMVENACGDLSRLGMFDLIFANASLQWMPDHKTLLRRYFGMLRRGGAVAMQVPRFERRPASHVIDTVARSAEFGEYFQGFQRGMYAYPDGYYYDALSECSREIDMWSTEYFHVMPGRPSIIEWLGSTALKPYWERLPEKLHAAFTARLLEGLKAPYPEREDGNVLFPFLRLFFIAYNR